MANTAVIVNSGGTGFSNTAGTFALAGNFAMLGGGALSLILNSGSTLTLPGGVTDQLVGRATTDTLTNKSISGGTNTLTAIPNGALTNSAVTIGSTSVSLGATAATIAGLTLTAPVLTTANLGTPSTLVLTNATGTPTSIGLANGTGLPISTGVSGLAAGIATFLATPTSANLAAAVTNETGTGALVFGTSPALGTPTITSATYAGTQIGTWAFQQNQNATSTFAFANNDSTDANSRSALTLTAGNRVIGFAAIHADANCYIQWTGGAFLLLQPTAGQNAPAAFAGSGSSAGRGNAAASSASFAKDTGTNRSINAEGSINASGADFAEFERKRGDCGTVEKGDIIGFDADGLLTDLWDNAIAFGVKSTDPCMVGGDTWGEEDRADFDRIAYSGKVPVNVFGAMPGDFIIATKAGSAIRGVPCANPTEKERVKTVGRVRRLLPDGRPQIAVMV